MSSQPTNVTNSNLDGFISWVSAYQGLQPGSAEELRLKIAALYYRNIFFPLAREHVRAICQSVALEAAVPSQLVAAVFRSIEELRDFKYPEQVCGSVLEADERYTWDGNGRIRIGLRGATKRSVAKQLGWSATRLNLKSKETTIEGYGLCRELAYTAAAATGSAKAWWRVYQAFPCGYVCFSEAESFAAKQRVLDQMNPINEQTIQEVRLLVPSIDKLPWEAVFDLRKSNAITQFRSWVDEGNLEHKPEAAIDHLWEAFAKIIPDTKLEGVKSILTNLPIPIYVNPLAIASSIVDVRKSHTFTRQHGAIFFFP